MIRRNVYAIQPYHVGTKDRKSLAIILPAEIVRECKIDPSDVLILKVNRATKRITLRSINTMEEDSQQNNNMATPTGESLAAYSQQVL